MMVKPCFWPGCVAARKNVDFNKSIRRFKVPKNPDLFEKWKKAVPQSGKELTLEDTICGLHFNDADINAFYEVKLSDGTIWKQKKGRSTLREGAIPCRDSNLQDFNRESILVRAKPREKKSRKQDLRNLETTYNRKEIFIAPKPNFEKIGNLKNANTDLGSTLRPEIIYCQVPNLQTVQETSSNLQKSTIIAGNPIADRLCNVTNINSTLENSSSKVMIPCLTSSIQTDLKTTSNTPKTVRIVVQKPMVQNAHSVNKINVPLENSSNKGVLASSPCQISSMQTDLQTCSNTPKTVRIVLQKPNIKKTCSIQNMNASKGKASKKNTIASQASSLQRSLDTTYNKKRIFIAPKSDAEKICFVKNINTALDQQKLLLKNKGIVILSLPQVVNSLSTLKGGIISSIQGLQHASNLTTTLLLNTAKQNPTALNRGSTEICSETTAIPSTCSASVNNLPVILPNSVKSVNQPIISESNNSNSAVLSKNIESVKPANSELNNNMIYDSNIPTLISKTEPLSPQPYSYSVFKSELQKINRNHWSTTIHKDYVGLLFWNSDFNLERWIAVMEDLSFKVYLKGQVTEIANELTISSMEEIDYLMKLVERSVICKGTDFVKENCTGYVQGNWYKRKSGLCPECREEFKEKNKIINTYDPHIIKERDQLMKNYLRQNMRLKNKVERLKKIYEDEKKLWHL